MERVKALNFFCEKDKLYNKEIDTVNLILISIIFFTITFNSTKFYKVQKLEEDVNERKSNLNAISLNNKDMNIQKKTSEICSILNLMNNNEMKSVEIKNKKLKFKGESNDFEKIKSYLEIAKKFENADDANIDFINNNENLYEFEISSFVGVKNESK
ncbi:hypothetical protein GCM10008904_13470 [Paraclostridium ghonii]|uniref:Fimbrial assembly protein (PilN) n=1 Tax=Paraclostridium ghonii TaxID=29358 RepID=A0ABU0N322_9FIRM|nr:hypothetical protein [Paeniclostridium ghonii]MDQ0557560.1 hypothetical protein [Paeniclostridium ghonii]